MTNYPGHWTGDTGSFKIDTGALRGAAANKSVSLVGSNITGFDVDTWQAIQFDLDCLMLPDSLEATDNKITISMASPFNAMYATFGYDGGGAGRGRQIIAYPGGIDGSTAITMATQKSGVSLNMKLWVSGGIWYGRIVLGSYDSGAQSFALAYPANKIAANPFTISTGAVMQDGAGKGAAIDNLFVFSTA